MAGSRRRLHFEALSPNFGYYYAIRRSILRKQTAFQDAEIVETADFGRALILDGATQIFQRKEFQYHEPLVHPALAAHPEPERVLIIGAGDGGVLREVLKHSCVAHVDMVELDGEVIELCREHFPEVHAGGFDDARTRLHVADGRAYVEGLASEANASKKYDVILMDMTDPQGPSTMLYTREFFAAVSHALADERGVFAMHAESPEDRPVAFASILRTKAAVFELVRPCYHFVHQYASNWCFVHSSRATDTLAVAAATIDARLRERGVGDLQIYSGAVHHAMTTGRPYIDRILAESSAPVITDAAPRFPDEFEHSPADLLNADE